MLRGRLEMMLLLVLRPINLGWLGYDAAGGLEVVRYDVDGRGCGFWCRCHALWVGRKLMLLSMPGMWIMEARGLAYSLVLVSGGMGCAGNDVAVGCLLSRNTWWVSDNNVAGVGFARYEAGR